MKQLKLIIAALIFLLPLTANAVPILTNGSLTGPIDNAGVPSGWTVLNPSPDTMDENNNVGVAGLGDFGATPSASPDGGTWVGFADDIGFLEVFGQNVSGFEIGTAYDVSWFQANFGYAAYTNADSIGLWVDGVLAGLSSMSALASGWTSESVQFTASSTTHLLSFGVGQNAGKSYMSIDGISVGAADGVSVPEPGTLALLGLGLAGMGMTRRKKKV